MRSRPTDPRDPRDRELAEGIGWMVMSAAALDVYLAMLVSELSPDSGQDWMAIAAETGGPLRQLRRIVSQLPAGARSAPALRRLLAEATEALEERHLITHSLHGLVIGYSDGTIKPGSIHPRGRTDTEMPTTERLAQLTDRLRDTARAALDLTPGVLRVNAEGRWVKINADGEPVPASEDDLWGTR